MGLPALARGGIWGQVRLGIGLSIGFLVACREPVPPNSTDGPAIFAAYCATCHGPDGRPPAAMIARLGVKDLTSPAVRAKATPDFVEQQVRKGSDNKLMPAFESVINGTQIQAVAAWVASSSFVTPPP
jgi:mono/diheme cytochrome c family protein